MRAASPLCWSWRASLPVAIRDAPSGSCSSPTRSRLISKRTRWAASSTRAPAEPGGETITAAVSIESVGVFSDAPDSQHYPWPFSWFYPKTGNFVGFIANPNSDALVRRRPRYSASTPPWPLEAAVLSESIDGIGWSDHWAFWQVGYPAMMVTDTAVFRNAHYHQPTERPRSWTTSGWPGRSSASTRSSRIWSAGDRRRRTAHSGIWRCGGVVRNPR